MTPASPVRLRPRALIASAAIAAVLSGCAAAGPDYRRPTAPTPAGYKALDGWAPAAPSDDRPRGDWWTLFGDKTLDDLAARVVTSNQTLAAAEAAYRQARALVREQRANLLPTVSLDGSAARNGGAGPDSSAYRVSIGASWEPDVWGRIRRTVEAAGASAQASQADLAAAQLSAQGELAINYLSLRETDQEIALLQDTVIGYQRALDITRNRYAAGIAPHSDALQAETQLASTQSQLEGLRRDRATLENAIAVLVGAPAGDFRLAVAPWVMTIPAVPVAVPSTLLERRPDIAAAERRVASANATIGVQQAAFFPTLDLTGALGQAASGVGALFSTAATVWSLGVSAAQTVFDAGARRARVDEARAAYDQTVANYRQTVLTAFQDVENQLTASQVLERQYVLLQQAATAAAATEIMISNQYRAGQVVYTDVVSAQATALNARRAAIQVAVARQTTAVALIQAVGGGWTAR